MPSGGLDSLTLCGRIDSLLYERHGTFKKAGRTCPAALAALKTSGEVGPAALVLKDPYILDFLDPKDQYIERDFEDAVLRELEMFLLELGAEFSLSALQKRIQLDGKDFYIDLLFYSRRLKRLVAVDLKQGSFRAEYKGQMDTLPSLAGQVRLRGGRRTASRNHPLHRCQHEADRAPWKGRRHLQSGDPR